MADIRTGAGSLRTEDLLGIVEDVVEEKVEVKVMMMTVTIILIVGTIGTLIEEEVGMIMTMVGMVGVGDAKKVLEGTKEESDIVMGTVKIEILEVAAAAGAIATMDHLVLLDLHL